MKTRKQEAFDRFVNFMLIVAVLFILITLFTSCEKETVCECTRITYIGKDGGPLNPDSKKEYSNEPCIEGYESIQDGWSGYDEDGNYYQVKCDY